MADFGINSTQLSDPQGRGTNPVAPVQEHVVNTSMLPILGEIGDIFAKGLKQGIKDQAEARKKAVLDAYAAEATTINSGLVSGQLNPSRASAMGRATFNKYLAGNTEYAQELTNLRSSLYGGTEVGEAQKKLDAEKKQQEADIGAASNLGYVFYPGMGDEAKNSQIEAYKATRRVEVQFQSDTARAAEQRAQNSEQRAAGTYRMSVDDYVAKENAVKGITEIADRNFDTLTTSFKDLQTQIANGMPYDQAIMIHNGNISRIKAGLLTIAGKNPEMASSWTKLFDDMDTNIKQQLDPKTKSADELKALQDKFSILVTQGKLAAVERNPEMLKAVVASNLFQGEPMVTLSNAPVVRDWLLAASGADPKLPPPRQMVGTESDAALFQNAKTAINRLQSGKVPADQQAHAALEATNVVNTLLQQTSTIDGSIDPRALKQASAFYSSTEFGKLALEGRIDKQTAANAQHVFQVQYDPVVKEAITNKLQKPLSDVEQEGYKGAKSLMDVLTVKTVGGNVVFDVKPAKSDGRSFPFSSDIIQQQKRVDRAQDFNQAATGLNQLIRMHAHLEGTTDYAKYWEANKHMLMPDIFPDPAKLKPGQVVDGYKYIGGNYRDRSNWIAEPTK